jgi:hypothetical protein
MDQRYKLSPLILLGIFDPSALRETTCIFVLSGLREITCIFDPSALRETTCIFDLSGLREITCMFNAVGSKIQVISPLMLMDQDFPLFLINNLA